MIILSRLMWIYYWEFFFNCLWGQYMNDGITSMYIYLLVGALWILADIFKKAITYIFYFRNSVFFMRVYKMCEKLRMVNKGWSTKGFEDRKLWNFLFCWWVKYIFQLCAIFTRDLSKVTLILFTWNFYLGEYSCL